MSEAVNKNEEIAVQNNDPCACIVGMKEWVEQPTDGKECRPCLLGPVIQWYMGELQEKGLNDLATEIEKAVEGGEVALATKLDEVKEKVSPELKARLREFDCHAQLYKGEEVGK